jgi:hypothetical protein
LYVHEVSAGAFRAHPLVKKFYSGTYIPPPPRAPEPLVSLTKIQSVKRLTPITGKKAVYGFDEDGSSEPPPKQASLKDYFGIPKPTPSKEVTKDPTKPARNGAPWKDDETIKMLMGIQKKKTIKELAAEHERTTGGIHSRLKALAVDYFYNDKKPVAEIEKITGLSSQVIQFVVNKNCLGRS